MRPHTLLPLAATLLLAMTAQAQAQARPVISDVTDPNGSPVAETPKLKPAPEPAARRVELKLVRAHDNDGKDPAATSAPSTSEASNTAVRTARELGTSH